MNKLLLSAAALLAVAGPGVAMAQDGAVIGLTYGNIDSDAFPDNLDRYDLSLGYSHEFSNGWTIQADGAEQRVQANSSSLGSSYAAVHLGVRNSSYALAGFVGLDSIIASGTTVGAEGQLYAGNLQLDASVGYGDFNDTFDTSLTNVDVRGTWFFTDDLAVSAHAGYSNADVPGDSDWTTLGISGAYRFANSPVSVTVGYDNRSGDYFVDDVHTWTLGVKFDIGSPTLRARSQSGPSLSGAETLHAETFWLF